MPTRNPSFTPQDLEKIHDASMGILKDVGVAFHEPEAVEIFDRHGFRVDGITVFFEETQVLKALETVPSKFSVYARNPARNVIIGEENFVLLPGWGAPFVIDVDGEQREATLDDYQTFCKLVHTSKYLDMNGFLMVMPSDVPQEHSHLDMLLSNMLLSDKAFMGSPQDRRKAVDSLEMATILFGGANQIRNRPVMPSKINPLSPLIYSKEMAGALIEYARWGQPLQFPDLILTGTSAPITLAGTAAVMNAEDLAGIVLAQLITPGTPCVYGGNSCATDMRTGGMALGGPEAIAIISIVAQLAAHYGIPSKGGGNLTDSYLPDMQAGVESALGIFMTLAAGNSMIDQSCGILASFNAMGFEKFLIDEQTCGMVRRILKPVEVTDETIGMGQIKRAGIGGAYITFDETYQRCRSETFIPELAVRESYEDWRQKGKQSTATIAKGALRRRLDQYQKPDIDPDIEKDLRRYVAEKKAG